MFLLAHDYIIITVHTGLFDRLMLTFECINPEVTVHMQIRTTTVFTV